MIYNNENIDVNSSLNANREGDKQGDPQNEIVRMGDISVTSLTENIEDTGINQEENETLDAASVLCELKKKNLNSPLLGHLNVNGIYNKFESLKMLVEGKIIFLLFPKRKLIALFRLRNSR